MSCNRFHHLNTFFRKISAAQEIPKLMCLYLNNQRGWRMLLMVLSRDEWSGIWSYPWLSSILLKTLQPFMSCTVSSIVGMMCHSLMMASFSFRMSTQIRNSLGFGGFGTITIDETQEVVPSAWRVMPSLSSCSNFLSTCFLTWMGCGDMVTQLSW